MAFSRLTTSAMRTRSVAPADAFTAPGRHGGGPMRRDDDTVRAQHLGAAHDGAQVVRVGDPVQQHQQRRLPGLRGGLQDVVDRHIAELARDGHDALVNGVPRQVRDQLPRPKLHGDAPLLGGLHDALDLGRARPVRDVDDGHVTWSGAHQLVDRPDAEDDPLAHPTASILADQSFERLCRLLGVAHRPADDQIVGPIGGRLPCGGDALLIIGGPRRARTDAGNDGQQPRRRGTRGPNFVRRADQPRQAGARRDTGPRLDHLGNRLADPLGAQVVLGQAGQHRDAQAP